MPDALVIKDSALLLLWLGFNPWPRNFCIMWVWPKKKKKKKKKKILLHVNITYFSVTYTSSEQKSKNNMDFSNSLKVYHHINWILISAPAFSLLWYHTSSSLLKTPLYFLRIRTKMTIILLLLWNGFDLMGPLKGSGDPRRVHE